MLVARGVAEVRGVGVAVLVARGVEVTVGVAVLVARGVTEVRGVGVAVLVGRGVEVTVGVAVLVARGVTEVRGVGVAVLVARGVEVRVDVVVRVGVLVLAAKSGTSIVRVDLVPRPNSSRYSTVMVRVPVPANLNGIDGAHGSQPALRVSVPSAMRTSVA